MPSVHSESGESVATLARQAALRVDSRLEADLLLSHIMGVDRSWIYAHGEAKLDSKQRARLESLIQARERGIPMAYVLGYREFYGRRFVVKPGVLVPRPETELLVESVLQLVTTEAARIADVGTGSGCIALTLAAERPEWQLYATDLSAEALAVCAENAKLLNLPKVELIRGDLLSPVAGQRFDAIVSNPPYVAAGDPHLSQGDLRFEPDLALSAGTDGLAIIRRLLSQAPQFLHSGGWLFIEHGYDQRQAVRQLLTDSGFMGIDSRKDLAGTDRITLGQLP